MEPHWIYRYGEGCIEKSIDAIQALFYLRTSSIGKTIDPGLKTLPVVMLTSSREEPDLKRSYDMGANEYVVKPVDFRDFIEAVKQVGVFWAVINELPPERT